MEIGTACKSLSQVCINRLSRQMFIDESQNWNLVWDWNYILSDFL